jgi:hypothetical protein
MDFIIFQEFVHHVHKIAFLMVKVVFVIKVFSIFLGTVQIIQLVQEQINILMELHVFVIQVTIIIQEIVHMDVDKIKCSHRTDVNAATDIIIFLEIVQHALRTLISMVYLVYVTMDYI